MLLHFTQGITLQELDEVIAKVLEKRSGPAMELYDIGDTVSSQRDPKLVGVIIGYGTISWPGDSPRPVYLVMREPRGSNSLTGPVVITMRTDQVVRQ